MCTLKPHHRNQMVLLSETISTKTRHPKRWRKRIKT